MEGREKEAMDLLKDVPDAKDMCRSDHNGNCQEHGVQPMRECWAGKIRRFLAKQEWEKAYTGIPKVRITAILHCCMETVRLPDDIPVGVYWEPMLQCPKCKKVEAFKIHIDGVRP